MIMLLIGSKNEETPAENEQVETTHDLLDYFTQNFQSIFSRRIAE